MVAPCLCSPLEGMGIPEASGREGWETVGREWRHFEPRSSDVSRTFRISRRFDPERVPIRWVWKGPDPEDAPCLSQCLMWSHPVPAVLLKGWGFRKLLEGRAGEREGSTSTPFPPFEPCQPHKYLMRPVKEETESFGWLSKVAATWGSFCAKRPRKTTARQNQSVVPKTRGFPYMLPGPAG